jgi:hypothetical protein
MAFPVAPAFAGPNEEGVLVVHHDPVPVLTAACSGGCPAGSIGLNWSRAETGSVYSRTYVGRQGHDRSRHGPTVGLARSGPPVPSNH